jgi:hypothetical protein
VEDAKRLGGRCQRERLALAQIQKAGGLVDLGASEHDRRDGACAQGAAWVQGRGRGKLRTQIRCGIQERPALTIG